MEQTGDCSQGSPHRSRTRIRERQAIADTSDRRRYRASHRDRRPAPGLFRSPGPSQHATGRALPPTRRRWPTAVRAPTAWRGIGLACGAGAISSWASSPRGLTPCAITSGSRARENRPRPFGFRLDYRIRESRPMRLWDASRGAPPAGLNFHTTLPALEAGSSTEGSLRLRRRVQGPVITPGPGRAAAPRLPAKTPATPAARARGGRPAPPGRGRRPAREGR
jgi:hypothetical protein